MENKRIKKIAITVIMTSAIMLVPVHNNVLGYTQTAVSSNMNMEMISKIIQKRKNGITKYGSYMQELDRFVKEMPIDTDNSNAKVQIIEKVEELQKKYADSMAASKVTNQIINQTLIEQEANTEELINKIKNSISTLISKRNLEIEGINPNKEVKDLEASTAKELLGKEYGTKLNGNIYYANSDNQGNPTSGKWAILLPGSLMNKQAITDEIGYMYLDQGINVLSVNLRETENSNGKMGFADALDAWDWLTYINENYENCEQIIVHGISSGATSTLYLSGMKINGQDIQDKKVIGIVEDSGYSSMTGIVTDMVESSKDNEMISKILGVSNNEIDFSNNTEGEALKEVIINQVGVGLTEENFDNLQNALDSLKTSKVPLLVIHSTEDTIVPVKHSEEIYQTAMENKDIPYVQKFVADGENHAFIVLGNKYNVYKGHIKEFIKQTQDIAEGKQVEKESNYQNEEDRKATMTTGIIKALKSIRNVLK